MCHFSLVQKQTIFLNAEHSPHKCNEVIRAPNQTINLLKNPNYELKETKNFHSSSFPSYRQHIMHISTTSTSCTITFGTNIVNSSTFTAPVCFLTFFKALFTHCTIQTELIQLIVLPPQQSQIHIYAHQSPHYLLSATQSSTSSFR